MKIVEMANNMLQGGGKKHTKPRKVNVLVLSLIAVIVVLTAVIIVLLATRPSVPEAAVVTLPEGLGQFEGKYSIDSYTGYEFDGAGNGALCLGNTTRYAFVYTVYGDRVSFDYKDVSIPDVTYKFSFRGSDIMLFPLDSETGYELIRQIN